MSKVSHIKTLRLFIFQALDSNFVLAKEQSFEVRGFIFWNQALYLCPEGMLYTEQK